MMSNTIRARRFNRYMRFLFRVIRKNFSLIISASALAFGGMTLLVYALSIEQLPEFSWNDLTGTLLAVFATGGLIVTVIGAYCLGAGYFARAALESVYPEAAGYSVGSNKAISPSVDEPYERLFSPRFILGSTTFGLLVWAALLLIIPGDKLISPYYEHLRLVLVIAFASIAALALIDRKGFSCQWMRHLLLSASIGASVTVLAMIVSWLCGPNDLMTKSVGAKVVALPFDWQGFWVGVLDHALTIFWSIAIGVMLLLNLEWLTSFLSKLVKTCFSKITPSSLSKRLASVKGWLEPFAEAVLGDPEDRKLIRAKSYVTGVFFVFTIVVLWIAALFASIGNAKDWGWNFCFLVMLLTGLNWVSFSVGRWRERAALGLLTVALMFFIYPMLAQAPGMFPRMIVTVLGLGNRHLDTIGVSAKQCATLAPYGVTCPADDKSTITLTNVNLLNRLGGVVSLELLVQEKKSDSKTQVDASAKETQTPSSPNLLMLPRPMEPSDIHVKKCDTILLSQLIKSDSINPDTLRCVALLIPKDQIAGYTTTRARTYRSDYSGYQIGPDEDPTVVKLLSGAVRP